MDDEAEMKLQLAEMFGDDLDEYIDPMEYASTSTAIKKRKDITPHKPSTKVTKPAKRPSYSELKRKFEEYNLNDGPHEPRVPLRRKLDEDVVMSDDFQEVTMAAVNVNKIDRKLYELFGDDADAIDAAEAKAKEWQIKAKERKESTGSYDADDEEGQKQEDVPEWWRKELHPDNDSSDDEEEVREGFEGKGRKGKDYVVEDGHQDMEEFDCTSNNNGNVYDDGCDYGAERGYY